MRRKSNNLEVGHTFVHIYSTHTHTTTIPTTHTDIQHNSSGAVNRQNLDFNTAKSISQEPPEFLKKRKDSTVEPKKETEVKVFE